MQRDVCVLSTVLSVRFLSGYSLTASRKKGPLKMRSGLFTALMLSLVSCTLIACGGGGKKYKDMDEPKLRAHVDAIVVDDWKSTGDGIIDTAGTVIVTDTKASIAKGRELYAQVLGNQTLGKFNRSVEAAAAESKAETVEDYEAIKAKTMAGFTASEQSEIKEFTERQKASLAEERARQAKILEAIGKLAADLAAKSQGGGKGIGAALLSSGGAFVEAKDALDKVSDQLAASEALLDLNEFKLNSIPAAAARNAAKAKEAK